MLKDGLYELFYRAESAPQDRCGTMLLSLRAVRIMAADPWGGVCQGTCSFDKRNRRYRFDVRFHVPPGGELVTDSAPRVNGDLIDIGADIDDPTGEAFTLVEVAGQPVCITLQFKGRMPV